MQRVKAFVVLRDGVKGDDDCRRRLMEHLRQHVVILLDYGYTVDEIEEFLTDTNLFQEALRIALGEDDASDSDQMGFDFCDICGW